ncbi:hypothetical protein Dimus_027748 [Dionaea muscipula]
MLLNKSFQKAKNFFHKAIQTLKSLVFVRYPNLPKSIALSSPLPSHNAPRDNLYKEKVENVVVTLKANDAYHGSGRSVKKISSEGILRNKQEARKKEGTTEQSCAKNGNATSYFLAKRMKELDMMDEGDVDHSLDVEEALHYYSQLTSPVYLDIVNEFFVDMYTEFFIPQPSISVTNSSRRLNSSSRRLGPLVL